MAERVWLRNVKKEKGDIEYGNVADFTFHGDVSLNDLHQVFHDFF